ncbi:MAG: hypothetical protein M0Z75_13710 [Nitrospiraceae bacterium]|nr:hypothetical protein [Nitrospiraceae bacterium]
MIQSLENLIKQIEEQEHKLVLVKNPTEVIAGSTDVDDQLFKLAVNIQVLTELKLLAGTEAVQLEQAYNQATNKMACDLTEDVLEAVGIVKSDKFKHIKFMLHEESARLDRMKAQYRYFADLYDTYKEWIQIYKKIRLPEGRY